MPKRDDERRASVIVQPKRGTASYPHDLDHTVAMALEHGRKTGKPILLWLDEIGRWATRDHTTPHMQEALEEGRHANLFMLECGPRPQNIDPLVLGQADLVYVFDMPNQRDIGVLASLAGVEPKLLAQAIKDLPPYGYLRIDTREHLSSGRRLVEFPPLPAPTGSAAP